MDRSTQHVSYQQLKLINLEKYEIMNKLMRWCSRRSPCEYFIHLSALKLTRHRGVPSNFLIRVEINITTGFLFI